MIYPSAVLRSCAQTLQESLGPGRGVPGAALIHSRLDLPWANVRLLLKLQENSLLLGKVMHSLVYKTISTFPGEILKQSIAMD